MKRWQYGHMRYGPRPEKRRAHDKLCRIFKEKQPINKKFFFTASYLIFLAHVNTFVLLTANFGDLKQIAQKFVPEAVADNIADFISKASESLTGTNISEENPENYNFKNKSSRDKESESEDSKYLEDAQSISDEVTTKSSIVSIDSIQAISTESFHNTKSKLESYKKRKRKIIKDKVDVNRKEVESKTVSQQQKTNDNVYVKPEKDDSKKNYQGHKSNDNMYVNSEKVGSKKVYQRHKTDDNLYVKSEKVGSKNLHQQKKTNVKVNINPAKRKSKKVYQRKKNEKVSVKSERVESHEGYQPIKTTSPENILEIKIEYDESEQSDEPNNVDSKSFTAGVDIFSDENKSLEKSNVVDSLNRYSDEEFQNNIVVKASPNKLNSKYSEFESNEYTESSSKHSNKDSLNQDGGKSKSEYSERVQTNESKDESKSIYSNESIQDNKYETDKSDSVTTRVERNEFDQYVNLNYPKSELVATSGPLALTMVVDTRIN